MQSIPTICQEHPMKSVLLACFLMASTVTLAQSDPYSQVDPFIGTQTSSQHDNGNTVPGATRPFGMLYWSPDPVYGDVPIFPMLSLPTQPPPVRSTPYRATFKHANEVAQPGYYPVKLDSGIEVQIAADVHSGIATIHYPAGTDQHTLLLDLSRNLTQVIESHIDIRGKKVTGSVASGGFCGLENRYKVYFALETQEAPQSAGTFDEMQVNTSATSASGPRAG